MGRKHRGRSPRRGAHPRVTELKAGNGRDIVCFGSLSNILIGPGAIGSGVPTFSNPVEQVLTLLDVRRMEDSQLVPLRYAVSEARRER
ncbi:MAG: hypothetical protein ACRDV2_04180 [Actinomycetes bacterium]